MAMSTLESGPKLDWTRDNQMYETLQNMEKEIRIHFLFSPCRFHSKTIGLLLEVLDG